jgi:CheY-like chemotaxis protein
VDICQVVSDALAIVQASVSRKILIRSDVPEDCPKIPADVGQLQQLVLNLVLNGAEAIGENRGEVSLQVRVRDVGEDELTERYPAYTLTAQQYTELVVSDTGSGMDEETLQRIFDPFFTTKFMGRGLGLAAALGVVRSHGGGISVKSAPGKGTTFTVLLPAEEGPAGPLTVSESITETARGTGLVLVVDDEVGIRTMLQTALEELGYTVITAENGAQGLELFTRSPGGFELIVLDVVMPVMDGPETARVIQSQAPELPILIMSGLGDQDALRNFSSVRIAGFVPKPFAPDQLAQAVAVARQSPERWAGKERRQQGADHDGPDRRTRRTPQKQLD